MSSEPKTPEDRAVEIVEDEGISYKTVNCLEPDGSRSYHLAEAITDRDSERFKEDTHVYKPFEFEDGE